MGRQPFFDQSPGQLFVRLPPFPSLLVLLSTPAQSLGEALREVFRTQAPAPAKGRPGLRFLAFLAPVLHPRLKMDAPVGRVFLDAVLAPQSIHAQPIQKFRL